MKKKFYHKPTTEIIKLQQQILLLPGSYDPTDIDSVDDDIDLIYGGSGDGKDISKPR